MFGFFKSKKTSTSDNKHAPGEPVIVALLLEGMTFPVDAFLKDVAKAHISGNSVKDINRGDGNVFSFQVNDELIALALMPAPYPAKDLEGPLSTSWMWPPQPPIETIKRHSSHLLITMTGGTGDPVRRRLIITAITALAAKQPGVMAIYWAEATHLIYPPVFIEMAKKITSPKAPPLYLWIDLRAFRNDDGTSGLFTTGLKPLGHMEIEIPKINMQIGELREWLINIMYYLLAKGPILKDGETIGTSAEQQIQIQHCPSMFGHSGNVMRLG